MNDLNDDLDPKAALDMIGEARAGVRERVDRAGVWFDITYAALAGLIIGAQALPFPIGVTAVSIGISGLAVMTRMWSKKTGLWVNGYSPRHAGKVAIVLAIGAAAAMLALTYVGKHGYGWIGGPAAICGAVLAFAAARIWRRVYLNELEIGA